MYVSLVFLCATFMVYLKVMDRVILVDHFVNRIVDVMSVLFSPSFLVIALSTKTLVFNHMYCQEKMIYSTGYGFMFLEIN